MKNLLLLVFALRLGAESCALTVAAGRSSSAPSFPAVAARFVPEAAGPLAVLPDGTLVFSWQDFIVRLDPPLVNAWSPAQQPSAGASSGTMNTALLPDGAGNLVVASRNNTVRLLRPDGSATLIAGTGSAGFSGDGGPAAKAALSNPDALAWMPDGALLIADANNYRIRRVALDGTIGTIAGLGGGDPTIGNEGPANRARIGAPTSMVVASDGSVFFLESGRVLRKITPDGIIHILGGDRATSKPKDDNVPLADAAFDDRTRLALSPAGRLLIVDLYTVRSLEPDGRLHVTAAMPAALAGAYSTPQIALAPDGTLYFTLNGSIVRLDPAGAFQTLVSNDGKRSLDGVPALTAPLNIQALGIGPEGDPYLLDQNGPAIYRVRTDGILEKAALQPKSSDYGSYTQRLVYDSQGRLVYWRNGQFYRVERDGSEIVLAGGGDDADPNYQGPGVGMSGYFSTGRFALGPDDSIYAAEIRRGAVYRIAPDGAATVYWRPAKPGLPDSAGVLLAQDGSLVLLGGDLRRLQPPSDSQVLVPSSNSRSWVDFFEDGGFYLLAAQTFEGGATFWRWLGSDLTRFQAPFPKAQIATTGLRNIILPDGKGNAWLLESYGGRLLELNDYPSCSGTVTPELDTIYNGDPSNVVAPGQPITLTGVNLGPSTAASAQVDGGTIATNLAGMSVTVAGASAPVLSAQANAITFQVPYGLDLVALAAASSPYQITVPAVVSNRGVSGAPFTLYLVATNPRPLGTTLNNYYGVNMPIMRNAGATLVTTANPVPRGGLFTVDFYGVGELAPPRATGEMPAIPLRQSAAAVAAHYHGRYLEIPWAGEVPGQPGLYRANLIMDPNAPSGLVRLVFLAGQTGVSIDVPVK